MVQTTNVKKSTEKNKDFWRIINLLNLGLIFIATYFLTQPLAPFHFFKGTSLAAHQTNFDAVKSVIIPL